MLIPVSRCHGLFRFFRGAAMELLGKGFISRCVSKAGLAKVLLIRVF